MDNSTDQTGKFRLLIVESLGLTRDGLLSLFQAAGDVRMATAEAGEDLRMVQFFVPDVVLLDLALPSHYAFSSARSMLALPRPPYLVFLDNAICPANISAALKMGARGYWTKQASFDELATAIRQVAAGELSFCPKAERYLV